MPKGGRRTRKEYQEKGKRIKDQLYEKRINGRKRRVPKKIGAEAFPAKGKEKTDAKKGESRETRSGNRGPHKKPGKKKAVKITKENAGESSGEKTGLTWVLGGVQNLGFFPMV